MKKAEKITPHNLTENDNYDKTFVFREDYERMNSWLLKKYDERQQHQLDNLEEIQFKVQLGQFKFADVLDVVPSSKEKEEIREVRNLLSKYLEDMRNKVSALRTVQTVSEREVLWQELLEKCRVMTQIVTNLYRIKQFEKYINEANSIYNKLTLATHSYVIFDLCNEFIDLISKVIALCDELLSMERSRPQTKTEYSMWYKYHKYFNVNRHKFLSYFNIDVESLSNLFFELVNEKPIEVQINILQQIVDILRNIGMKLENHVILDHVDDLQEYVYLFSEDLDVIDFSIIDELLIQILDEFNILLRTEEEKKRQEKEEVSVDVPTVNEFIKTFSDISSYLNKIIDIFLTQNKIQPLTNRLLKLYRLQEVKSEFSSVKELVSLFKKNIRDDNVVMLPIDQFTKIYSNVKSYSSLLKLFFEDPEISLTQYQDDLRLLEEALSILMQSTKIFYDVKRFVEKVKSSLEFKLHTPRLHFNVYQEQKIEEVLLLIDPLLNQYESLKESIDNLRKVFTTIKKYVRKAIQIYHHILKLKDLLVDLNFEQVIRQEAVDRTTTYLIFAKTPSIIEDLSKLTTSYGATTWGMGNILTIFSNIKDLLANLHGNIEKFDNLLRKFKAIYDEIKDFIKKSSLKNASEIEAFKPWISVKPEEEEESSSKPSEIPDKKTEQPSSETTQTSILKQKLTDALNQETLTDQAFQDVLSQIQSWKDILFVYKHVSIIPTYLKMLLQFLNTNPVYNDLIEMVSSSEYIPIFASLIKKFSSEVSRNIFLDFLLSIIPKDVRNNPDFVQNYISFVRTYFPNLANDFIFNFSHEYAPTLSLAEENVEKQEQQIKVFVSKELQNIKNDINSLKQYNPNAFKQIEDIFVLDHNLKLIRKIQELNITKIGVALKQRVGTSKKFYSYVEQWNIEPLRSFLAIDPEVMYTNVIYNVLIKPDETKFKTERIQSVLIQFFPKEALSDINTFKNYITSLFKTAYFEYFKRQLFGSAKIPLSQQDTVENLVKNLCYSLILKRLGKYFQSPVMLSKLPNSPFVQLVKKIFDELWPYYSEILIQKIRQQNQQLSQVQQFVSNIIEHDPVLNVLLVPNLLYLT